LIAISCTNVQSDCACVHEIAIFKRGDAGGVADAEEAPDYSVLRSSQSSG
jgi:hypothetical protein